MWTLRRTRPVCSFGVDSGSVWSRHVVLSWCGFNCKVFCNKSCHFNIVDTVLRWICTVPIMMSCPIICLVVVAATYSVSDVPYARLLTWRCQNCRSGLGWSFIDPVWRYRRKNPAYCVGIDIKTSSYLPLTKVFFYLYSAFIRIIVLSRQNSFIHVPQVH